MTYEGLQVLSSCLTYGLYRGEWQASKPDRFTLKENTKTNPA
jgi:hypothetical protein